MSPLALVVLHEPGPGGGTNTVLRALPGLQQAGWDFSFWAQPGPTADRLRADGYPVHVRSRPIRYSWPALAEPPGPWRRLSDVPGYLTDFRRVVARTAPDLVHANTVLTLPEALAGRSAGAATLLHVHEMLAGVRGAVAGRLARLIDDVAADSDACADTMRRHGVAVGLVTAGVSSPGELPTARPPGPLIVGTVATVSRRKGSDIFVAAAAAVLAERGDVEFRMVGPLAPGPEEAWAREVAERATRVGIRRASWAELSSELRGWDVFVLPTREDPFPLVVLDAMAAELPVVASAVDGVVEQVDAASGILVPADDADAIRDAVVSLLDNPERRLQMGRAGAARVARDFTTERHTRELLAAYERALASRRRRSRAPSVVPAGP